MIEYLGCWNTFRRQNILNIQKVSSCESKGKFKLTIFFLFHVAKMFFSSYVRTYTCRYMWIVYIQCLCVTTWNEVSEKVKKLSIEQIKACSRAFSFLSLSTHMFYGGCQTEESKEDKGMKQKKPKIIIKIMVFEAYTSILSIFLLSFYLFFVSSTSIYFCTSSSR